MSMYYVQLSAHFHITTFRLLHLEDKFKPEESNHMGLWDIA